MRRSGDGVGDGTVNIEEDIMEIKIDKKGDVFIGRTYEGVYKFVRAYCPHAADSFCCDKCPMFVAFGSTEVNGKMVSFKCWHTNVPPEYVKVVEDER